MNLGTRRFGNIPSELEAETGTVESGTGQSAKLERCQIPEGTSCGFWSWNSVPDPGDGAGEGT
jgi:hypothetical protein